MKRRKFIKQVSAAAVVSSMPNVLLSQQKYSNDKIWALLLHLSVNMWKDYYADLQLSESLWKDVLEKMVDAGMNMVVIDLGDGVQYESHPEIAVNNAWTTTQLQNELGEIRNMGLEPIPKMNSNSKAAAVRSMRPAVVPASSRRVTLVRFSTLFIFNGLKFNDGVRSSS